MAQGRRLHDTIVRHARHRRLPAPAGRRVEAHRRPGPGRHLRRRREPGWHRRAARDERREGRRIPTRPRRRRRRHSRALSQQSARHRRPGRAQDRHPQRADTDLELRDSASLRPTSTRSQRSTASRSSRFAPTSQPGCSRATRSTSCRAWVDEQEWPTGSEHRISRRQRRPGGLYGLSCVAFGCRCC